MGNERKHYTPEEKLTILAGTSSVGFRFPLCATSTNFVQPSSTVAQAVLREQGRRSL
jgi:hypothetical protein